MIENMSFGDISVVILSLVFATSGYIINFIRGKNEINIQYANDKHSLEWFRFLVPFGLIASMMFYFFGIGSLSYNVIFIIIGFLLVTSGMIIRWWAVLSLGKEFNVSLSIIRNHRLKTDGIYSMIRHPSYTGLLMYYIGLAAIMQNTYSLLILIIFPAIAVVNRIKKEEDLLSGHFKADYVIYCRSTKKLFPFIY